MSINNNATIKKIKENLGKEMWLTMPGDRAFKTSNAHFTDETNTEISFTDIKGNEITCDASQILAVQIVADKRGS